MLPNVKIYNKGTKLQIVYQFINEKKLVVTHNNL